MQVALSWANGRLDSSACPDFRAKPSEREQRTAVIGADNGWGDFADTSSRAGGRLQLQQRGLSGHDADLSGRNISIEEPRAKRRQRQARPAKN
jgi:hypothetical protein